jgi:hypothetical protein
MLKRSLEWPLLKKFKIFKKFENRPKIVNSKPIFTIFRPTHSSEAGQRTTVQVENDVIKIFQREKGHRTRGSNPRPSG